MAPKVAVLKVLHVLQLFYLQSPLAVSTPQVLLCLLMCVLRGAIRLRVELMTKVSEAISVSIMKICFNLEKKKKLFFHVRETLDKYSSCLKAVLDVKTSDTNCHLLQTFKNKGGQLYPPFVLMVRSFKWIPGNVYFYLLLKPFFLSFFTVIVFTSCHSINDLTVIGFYI